MNRPTKKSLKNAKYRASVQRPAIDRDGKVTLFTGPSMEYVDGKVTEVKEVTKQEVDKDARQ